MDMKLDILTLLKMHPLKNWSLHPVLYLEEIQYVISVHLGIRVMKYAVKLGNFNSISVDKRPSINYNHYLLISYQ